MLFITAEDLRISYVKVKALVKKIEKRSYFAQIGLSISREARGKIIMDINLEHKLENLLT